MRTILAILAIVLLIVGLSVLSGCASMKCEPYGDTIWKSENHAAFSLWGYKSITNSHVKKSKEEGWTGCPVYAGKN